MNSHVSFLDWVLILGFLGCFAFLGFRARKHSSSLDEYLVMGRRLGPIWGVATLAATETGLVTLVYFSEEAYLSGFVALTVAFLAAATMWAVGRTGFVVSRLRALQVRTVPEFMEERFSPGVRSFAGLATFTVGVLNMGIVLPFSGVRIPLHHSLRLPFLRGHADGPRGRHSLEAGQR